MKISSKWITSYGDYPFWFVKYIMIINMYMQRLVLICLFIKLRERLSKSMGINMSDYFRFGLVFIKKITKPVFFKKLELVQTDQFQFFRTKTGSNRFCSFFSRLTRIFTVWVRFGFFSFRLIKPKPNRSVFLKFYSVFFKVWFFQLFLFYFINLIDFLIFLLIIGYKYA
jgi:hypothetical protein